MTNTPKKWMRRIILVLLLGSIVFSLLAYWRATSEGCIQPCETGKIDQFASHLLGIGIMMLLAGTIGAGIAFRWAVLLIFPAGAIAGYAFDMIRPSDSGPMAIFSFGIGMPGLFVITLVATASVKEIISALKWCFHKRQH